MSPASKLELLLAQCDGMSTVPNALAGLPDPDDHDLAWVNGEPSYLAWWRRITETIERADVSDVVFQQRLLARYAQAVPSTEALDVLVELGPLIEIGAGGGYWARLLRDHGCDVLAFDNRTWAEHVVEPWSAVEFGDIDVLDNHRDRAVFVCWPPRPNGFMPPLLDTAPQNSTLALITDGPTRSISGGDPMFNRLDNDWTRTHGDVAIPRWPGRSDRLMVWCKR